MERRTVRQRAATGAIAAYAAAQAGLGVVCLMTAADERDAHAIARCTLYVLGCIALGMCACASARTAALYGLATALSYLVDCGVRLLAAGSALASPSRNDAPPVDLPVGAVFAQLALTLFGLASSRAAPSPVRICARAHAVITALARAVDMLPTLSFTARFALSEFISAALSLAVALQCAAAASASLLSSDDRIAAAKRKIHDVVRDASHPPVVWRDQGGVIRALVIASAAGRDPNAIRSRLRSALDGLVDELFVQVDQVPFQNASSVASPRGWSD